MNLRRNIGLILLFARQALAEGYRSSHFGLLWLFAEQLAFILIFTLVFSRLMGARLGQFDNPYAFSIYLVGGLLSWNLMTGTLLRLADVYRAKAHFIRKVPMPLAVLPLFAPLAELMILAVGAGFYVIFLVLIGHGPASAWWSVPPVLAALLVFAYGGGMLLGVLNVFFSDIKHLVAILLQFSFWLTPIVYVPDILPPWVQSMLWLNLPYLGIEAVQQAMLEQRLPGLAGPLVLALVGLLLGALALFLLRRLERDIRDLV